jgi:DNA-binding NarL/FixJ family response regulator
MRQHSTASLIRVLVSDDMRVHTELLADTLKRDGGLQVTTSVAGAEGLLKHLNHNNVDVLLLSSNLGEQLGGGFEVLRTLRSSNIDVPAVLLLDSSKPEIILEAFHAGARGVFSRHESVQILSKCVRRVHEGQIWANSQQMALLVQALSSSHNVRAVDARGMNLLSKREMEIVHSVAQGLTNREIAERLGLSPHTIKNCLFRIFDKLGVSNRVELLFMTLIHSNHRQSVFEHFLGSQGDQNLQDETTLVACQKAAHNGILVAQLALAQFYAARRASPEDALQSYQWYSAVGKQISRACEKANKGMTIGQLLQVERMAANLRNKRSQESGSASKGVVREQSKGLVAYNLGLSLDDVATSYLPGAIAPRAGEHSADAGQWLDNDLDPEIRRKAIAGEDGYSVSRLH